MAIGLECVDKAGFQYLEIPSFAATGLVRHGFSTRHGGVSGEPFSSLNLALHVGDNPEAVRQNRQSLSSALGINASHWVTAQQVHGARVAVVTGSDQGRGAVDYPDALPDTDALITRERGVPLATFYADCVPVFFLDPVTPAIGLAHAGWKGTVYRIPTETLKGMGRYFGTRPEDCLVGIGPSIGPCCFEVDEQVVIQFQAAFDFWPQVITAAGEGKWLVDLWQVNLRALMEAGVPAENITVAGECTRCHPETYFSFRAEKGQTGRMGGVIMLR
ncbi:MAG TPA: peptidoglycan editing factor PgeF [Bacillota bacterium]|nr:peptidoglycan editing factor PgeF [Bacillota bacterium]